MYEMEGAALSTQILQVWFKDIGRTNQGSRPDLGVNMVMLAP